MPNTPYTISLATSIFTLNIVFYNENKEFISRNMIEKTGGTFITTNNTKYIRIFMNKDNLTTMTQSIIDSFNIMLVLGTKVAEYEPYLHNEKIHILNDDNMYEEFIKKEEKTILYDNPSGNNGTITLSDSAENYNYIEIFFFSGKNYAYYSTKIANPNGKNTQLSYSEVGDTLQETYFFKRQIQINDKNIDTMNNNYGLINFTGTISSKENTIFICKVVGYKD